MRDSARSADHAMLTLGPSSFGFPFNCQRVLTVVGCHKYLARQWVGIEAKNSAVENVNKTFDYVCKEICDMARSGWAPTKNGILSWRIYSRKSCGLTIRRRMTHGVPDFTA